MTGHACGGRRTRGDAEDHSRPADVRVHARLGDSEDLRDLLCGKPAGDGAQDLALTIRQRGDRVTALAQDTSREEIPGKNSDQD